MPRLGENSKPNCIMLITKIGTLTSIIPFRSNPEASWFHLKNLIWKLECPKYFQSKARSLFLRVKPQVQSWTPKQVNLILMHNKIFSKIPVVIFNLIQMPVDYLSKTTLIQTNLNLERDHKVWPLRKWSFPVWMNQCKYLLKKFNKIKIIIKHQDSLYLRWQEFRQSKWV